MLVFILKMTVILVILAGAVYFILFSSLFSINVIYVEGTREFVNKEDVRLMSENNALGHNIFKFDEAQLSEKLSNNLLGARSYLVKKELPHTIRIVVNERIPIAVLYKENDASYFVDEDGYVLGYADDNTEGLPKIQYDKEIKAGLFIDKNLVPVYLELTRLLKEEDVKVTSMSFSAKHVNLYLENEVEVLVGNEKNKQEALKTVAALLKEAVIEHKEIRRIDMRYDKVIVLFK